MKCLSERSFNSERNKRREQHCEWVPHRNKRIHRKTQSFDCESGDLKVKQEHCVTCTLKWSKINSLEVETVRVTHCEPMSHKNHTCKPRG